MIGLTVEAQEGEAIVARVAGEIDSVTSGELRDGLSRRLTNTAPGLILDLSEATYVDSAGIEFLFDLAQRLRTRGQYLRLVVPPGAPMRRVFDLCGVESVIDMHPTFDDALRSTASPEPHGRGAA